MREKEKEQKLTFLSFLFVESYYRGHLDGMVDSLRFDPVAVIWHYKNLRSQRGPAGHPQMMLITI